MRGNFLEKVSPHPFKNLETVLERKTANPSRIREGFLLFIRLLLQFCRNFLHLLFLDFIDKEKHYARNTNPNYNNTTVQPIVYYETTPHKKQRMASTTTNHTNCSAHPKIPLCF